MVLDQEGSNNLFNHIMELWINPEIERRTKAGRLPEKFFLTAAQVIMYPNGKPTVIRLNKEVKAEIVGVASRAIKVKEEFVLEDGLKEIKELRLTERDDPDAGHITLINFNGELNIVFDFRYNKKKANDRLEAAMEFLDSAKSNYEKNKWRPFVDNMFSVTELLATAQLLPHADEQYTKKQSHPVTEKKYNSFVALGNFKVVYKDTLLDLRRLRRSARYLNSDFNLTKAEAERYLKVLNDMVDFTKSQLR